MDHHTEKFLDKITCRIEIKEEVIFADNTNDSESTLSDHEKKSDLKIIECAICHKYQSMFMILKNHVCQFRENKCNLCIEILHWGNCFKSHKESHEIKTEWDQSGDTTASDLEESKEKCKICIKYEFMIPLLQSHICKFNESQKCCDCYEVVQWRACYKKHKESHESQRAVNLIKEENSGDSTTSDNENIQKLLPDAKKCNKEKCQICWKYEVMLIILKESHVCGSKRSDAFCEKCDEIIQWSHCFENHRKSHSSKIKICLEKKKNQIDFLNFSKNFDCGICLKLNSFVTNLVKNHTCIENKSCKVCQEVSYWLSCLKSHKESERKTNFIKTDKTKVVGPWIPTNCSVCIKLRNVIIKLSDHICKQIRGKTKCEMCEENSFWFRNLRLHEKYHSMKSTFKNSLPCEDCGKRFSKVKMLRMHKSYCESSLVCNCCDQQFTNFWSLRKHRVFQSVKAEMM